MKIAIISDTHLGYARFEEDSYAQAENAFLDADKNADLIIYAGDVFDTKTPTLETLNHAVDILKKVKKPIFAIHGNHERRSRGMVNPVQLLATMKLLTYLHAKDSTFENNNKKVQIFGLGNVPEELASQSLKKALDSFKPDDTAFKILVIHQSIKDLIPHAKDEITLDELRTLHFDLIINGHIHGSVVELGGKFLIPGSTIVTQLKKEETSQRGYMLYDTAAGKHEFIGINCRKFFYEELKFADAGMAEVKNAVGQRIRELRMQDENAIIRIKVRGSLREGMAAGDLSFTGEERVYIENHLNSETLKGRLEKIKGTREQKLSVKEVAIKELEDKVKDRITLFSPRELFDVLVMGTDETLAYLKNAKKQA